ncbi:elongation factor P 5-aminopentanone reductase [Oceanobacillus sp. J11TS1]|uniref:elongation factor P 5-aminopentanone reductase n=1 Tax=Oceanobacillus sp. J11TS1 TaxID=2807191 RepID=UPI001B2171C8|nr:SDR family oxidoreductase [Oceanobacillus sp. J11TS1]GIO22029.1 3-ketoacyl-ACP reductase [Oceanobacillus sp. J11TS1]
MKGNILLIGASGDIGAAIAKKLIHEGYQLMLHYHSNQAPVQELLQSDHQHAILAAYQADLAKEEEVKAFIRAIPFSVDAVVFASGQAYHGLFQDMKEEEMDDLLQVHVKSPWLITHHFLPEMILRQRGNILFVTSVWGEYGASNEVVYSSVKGAQNVFVKALAKEVALSNIRVNAVSPGFIDTKMNHHLSLEEANAFLDDVPANRAGRPEEVANLIHYLLGEESSYIQGEIIHINGGL